MVTNKHITKTMNISDMQTLVDLKVIVNNENKTIEVSNDGSGYTKESVVSSLGVTSGDIDRYKSKMNPYIHTLYDQTKIKGNMGEAYNRYTSDVVHPFVVAKLMEVVNVCIVRDEYKNINTDVKDRIHGLSIIDGYGKLCSLAMDRIVDKLDDKCIKVIDDFKLENLNNTVTLKHIKGTVSHEEMADAIMYISDTGSVNLSIIAQKMGYELLEEVHGRPDLKYITIKDKSDNNHVLFHQTELLYLMVKFDPKIKNECIKLYHKVGKFLYSDLLGRNGTVERKHIVDVGSYEHLLFKEIAKETKLRMEEPVNGKVNIAGVGMLLFATDARVPSDKNMLKILDLMTRQTLGFVHTSFIFSVFYSETKSVETILREGLHALLIETNKATVTQLLVWMDMVGLANPNSEAKMDLSNDLTAYGFHVGYTNNVKYDKVKVFDFKLASEKLTTQNLMEG